MKSLLVAVPLLAILGVALWAAFRMWTMLPGATLSGHGWLALFLGAFLSLAVGIGLMALIFYSHRHGYDEAADRAARRDRGDGSG